MLANQISKELKFITSIRQDPSVKLDQSRDNLASVTLGLNGFLTYEFKGYFYHYNDNLNLWDQESHLVNRKVYVAASRITRVVQTYVQLHGVETPFWKVIVGLPDVDLILFADSERDSEEIANAIMNHWHENGFDHDS